MRRIIPPLALLFSITALLTACGNDDILGGRIKHGMSTEEVIAELGEPTLTVDSPSLLPAYGVGADISAILAFLIENPDATDKSNSHLSVIVHFNPHGAVAGNVRKADSLGKVKQIN